MVIAHGALERRYGFLSLVLDVLPSELTFPLATENGPASVELGADMPADRIDISCFYTNVATNEVSEEYPTEAGTYQISVILKAKGLSDELKYNIYQNRVEWNGRLPSAFLCQRKHRKHPDLSDL